MKYRIIILPVILAIIWAWYMHALAVVSLDAHVPWNCTNMKTNPHPIPVSFYNDGQGNWVVDLADGSQMTSKMLTPNIMRWDWESAWWHTNGTDVVYCESDLKAMSILLSK